MTEVSSALVVGLGIGTVFVGLIAIIVLCYLMSAVCKLFEKGKKSEEAPVKATPAAVSNAPIANKQEIIAACSAVIAEELGTEANNIRILSFKRI